MMHDRKTMMLLFWLGFISSLVFIGVGAVMILQTLLG
jgi:hypothetical protein